MTHVPSLGLQVLSVCGPGDRESLSRGDYWRGQLTNSLRNMRFELAFWLILTGKRFCYKGGHSHGGTHPCVDEYSMDGLLAKYCPGNPARTPGFPKSPVWASLLGPVSWPPLSPASSAQPAPFVQKAAPAAGSINLAARAHRPGDAYADSGHSSDFPLSGWGGQDCRKACSSIPGYRGADIVRSQVTILLKLETKENLMNVYAYFFPF